MVSYRTKTGETGVVSGAASELGWDSPTIVSLGDWAPLASLRETADASVCAVLPDHDFSVGFEVFHGGGFAVGPANFDVGRLGFT